MKFLEIFQPLLRFIAGNHRRRVNQGNGPAPVHREPKPTPAPTRYGRDLVSNDNSDTERSNVAAQYALRVQLDNERALCDQLHARIAGLEAENAALLARNVELSAKVYPNLYPPQAPPEVDWNRGPYE